MKKLSYVVFGYAILILIGGIMGHVKAGSRPSLIMGILLGALLLLSGWAMFKEKKYGYNAAIGLSFFLDAFFTYRFTVTHHFFPSGMMSLISLVVLIWLLIQRKQNYR